MLREMHWIVFLAAVHTWPGWAIALGVVGMLVLDYLRRRLRGWHMEILGK